MKFLAFLVFSVFCFSSGLQEKPKSLQFEELTLKQAIAKAKIEGKGVFLAYMAPWCGTCQFMKKHNFTNNELIEIFESNFICIKFNKEKVFTYPAQLKDVTWETLPAMFFFNKQGELEKQLEGIQSVEDLIEVANDVAEP